MKKASLLLIAAAYALSAHAQDKDYSLRLADFNELQVVDGINVDYRNDSDSAGIVTFTCDPALAELIMFESSSKRLKIQLSFDDRPVPAHLPTLKVSSSSLTKIENSGDSTVTVTLDGPQPSFKARVVGNGTIVATGIYTNSADGRISTGHGHLVMRGRAGRLKLSNVGTGPIEAGALEAKDVKCWAVGTGSIDCNVSESLVIFGAGSGKVYYTGSPAKVSNRTIGVKAISIDSAGEEQ